MRVFHGDDDQPLRYCNFERNRPTELFHVSSFISPSVLLEGTENSTLSDYAQS